MSRLPMVRLAPIAESHWGLFTAEEAASVSVDRRTLSRLSHSGVIVRAAHGVYRVAGAPELEHEAIYTTWLALGGTTRAATATGLCAVVAAGETAAVLHGIGDFFGDVPDFIVPTRRSTRLKARVRTQTLTPREVSFAEGVPVLSVERTLADLVALWTDASLVTDALASAVEQGKLVSPRRFAEYLDPYAHDYGYSDGGAFSTALHDLAGLSDQVMAFG